MLRICCGAEAQETALVDKLNSYTTDEARVSTVTLAQRLLAEFDLVPKGAGQGILDAYRPFFKHP